MILVNLAIQKQALGFSRKGLIFVTIERSEWRGMLVSQLLQEKRFDSDSNAKVFGVKIFLKITTFDGCNLEAT